MSMEVLPAEANFSNKDINNKENIKKKIILKFLVRFYFFINHKLKLAQDKYGEDSKYNQETKDEIIKRFFEEDSRNLNRLANSADMLLIKPYFQKLCDNSYDNEDTVRIEEFYTLGSANVYEMAQVVTGTSGDDSFIGYVPSDDLIDFSDHSYFLKRTKYD